MSETFSLIDHGVVTRIIFPYQFWCNFCQEWHDSIHCPLDSGMGYWPADNGMNYLPTADNVTIEICPHCGQEIKR